MKMCSADGHFQPGSLHKREQRVSMDEKAHQAWLKDKFKEFDYANDARFESMRDYPRRRQLYRKHVDIGKDYERKYKYYKHWQKWYDSETRRQMQNVEARFSKLIQHTFESNRSKTHGLIYSYHGWIYRNNKSVDLNKSFDMRISEMASVNEPNTVDAKNEVKQTKAKKRVTSHRSASVPDIPIELEKSDQDLLEGPRLVKAMSSLTVNDLTQSKKVRRGQWKSVNCSLGQTAEC